LLVAVKPTIAEARPTPMAASIPWARRNAKSMMEVASERIPILTMVGSCDP
jgi:hypothetical protein